MKKSAPYIKYKITRSPRSKMAGPKGQLPEQGVAEGSDSNLSYQGNCTEDDVIEHIFGDVNNFANMVEEHGDEFTVGDLVVKYDPETDVHSFYYKKQGVAEGSQEINWVKPNFDFEWHEVEEQSRMKQVPIDVRQYYQKHFPNKDAWLKAVQNGKAVVVPPDHAYEIRNAPFDKASLQKVLAPTGHEGPIGPAKEKRVNDLFDKGQVEMPIILKTSQGLWLIGGKTRLGTANYVKGLPAKVWLISGKQGVAEGLDDPWGDQGNFAGDKPVNIGGDTVKQLQVGDIVTYFGQKARIEAMSKTGNTSRITIANKMGGTTQDVLTRDLKRTGVAEEIGRAGGGFGTNYPGTYEQENGPFTHKGGLKLTSLTTESVDYLDEK
jgi:hypothetical protein